jgi:hypothetical protein
VSRILVEHVTLVRERIARGESPDPTEAPVEAYRPVA